MSSTGRLSCLLGLLLMLGLKALAHAGPVERELKFRGSNVGTPTSRPLIDNQIISNHSATNSQTPSRKLPTAENNQRPIIETKEESPEAEPMVRTDTPPPQFDQVCFSRLSKIAVIERVIQPVTNDLQCVIPTPVILKATRSNSPVIFTDGLLLDCGFAETLVKFTSSDLQQAAHKNMQSPLVKIESGQGFVCRRRNNLPTGKLSEHAFGNALDFIGFGFANGNSINIRSADEMPEDKANFFKQIRQASCSSFTTVLGPGANAAHATHLHVDLGRSKGNPNPYRICE